MLYYGRLLLTSSHYIRFFVMSGRVRSMHHFVTAIRWAYYSQIAMDSFVNQTSRWLMWTAGQPRCECCRFATDKSNSHHGSFTFWECIPSGRSWWNQPNYHQYLFDRSCVGYEKTLVGLVGLLAVHCLESNHPYSPANWSVTSEIANIKGMNTRNNRKLHTAYFTPRILNPIWLIWLVSTNECKQTVHLVVLDRYHLDKLSLNLSMTGAS